MRSFFVNTTANEFVSKQNYIISTFVPKVLGQFKLRPGILGEFKIDESEDFPYGISIEIPEDAIDKEEDVEFRASRGLKGVLGFGFSKTIFLKKEMKLRISGLFDESIILRGYFSESLKYFDSKSTIYSETFFPNKQTRLGLEVNLPVMTGNFIFESNYMASSECSFDTSVRIIGTDQYNDSKKILCDLAEKYRLSNIDLKELINNQGLLGMYGAVGFCHPPLYLNFEQIKTLNQKFSGTETQFYKRLENTFAHESYHYIQLREIKVPNKGGPFIEQGAQAFAFEKADQITLITDDIVGTTNFASDVRQFAKRSLFSELNGDYYSNFGFFYEIVNYDYLTRAWASEGKDFDSTSFFNINLSSEAKNAYFDYMHSLLNLENSTFIGQTIKNPVLGFKKGWTIGERGWGNNNKNDKLEPYGFGSYIFDNLSLSKISNANKNISLKLTLEGGAQGVFGFEGLLCTCASGNCGTNSSGIVGYSGCASVTERKFYGVLECSKTPCFIETSQSVDDEISQGKKHFVVNAMNSVVGITPKINFNVEAVGTLRPIVRVTRKDYYKNDVGLTDSKAITGIPLKFSMDIPDDTTVKWFCKEEVNGQVEDKEIECGVGKEITKTFSKVERIKIRGEIKKSESILGWGSTEVSIISPTALTIDVPVYKNIIYGNCPSKSRECVIEGSFQVKPFGMMYFKDVNAKLCQDTISIDAMDNYGNIGEGVVKAATTIAEKYPLVPIVFGNATCLNYGCPFPNQNKSCGIYLQQVQHVVDCGIQGRYELCANGKCSTGNIFGPGTINGDVFWAPGDSSSSYSLNIDYGEQSNSISGSCQ